MRALCNHFGSRLRTPLSFADERSCCVVILSPSPTWKSSATTCRTWGPSLVRLRPRQVQCARALHFRYTASVVTAVRLLGLRRRRARAVHSYYTKSVILLPKPRRAAAHTKVLTEGGPRATRTSGYDGDLNPKAAAATRSVASSSPP